jgi:hypothetical protein
MSKTKNQIDTFEVETRYQEKFIDIAKRQGRHLDIALFGKRCENPECRVLLEDKPIFKSFLEKDICEECYCFEQSQFEMADMLGK